MPVARYETVLSASPQKVWDFHASPEALLRLTPPNRKLSAKAPELPPDAVGSGPTPLVDGAVHVLEFKLGPFRPVWRARISDVSEPHGFVDTAEQSPFRRWVHRHAFEPAERGCKLIDEIEFELPFAPLSHIALPFVVRDLRKLFEFRHRVTKDALEGRSTQLG